MKKMKRPDFHWTLTEADFAVLKSNLKKGKADLADRKVAVGNYEVEFVTEFWGLIDDQGRYSESTLCLNEYLLGGDGNYGHTKSGMPYEFTGGPCLPKSEVLPLDFNGFKKIVEDRLLWDFSVAYKKNSEGYRKNVLCPLADWS